MKNILLGTIVTVSLAIAACNKSHDTPAVDFETLKGEVLASFVSNVGLVGYAQLDAVANAMETAVQNLNSSTSEGNLAAARTSWKTMRSVWEKCEGYLFGPVEDNNFDPNMDTWPTDYVQMDSLLASSNALTVNDIKVLTLSLRGFHPIEYILFGDHGDRTAASLTARQKLYMLSLATDIKNTCHDLNLSWTTAPVNYAQQIVTAGSGSTVFSKKQEAYLAIVGAMVGICEEVGEGKMKEPFDAMDPQIVESPYSGNSVSDFRDNIIGLQNVYLGHFGGADGKGINDLVAAKNIALDNKIQTQITAAINSFDNITMTYEEAIINQRVQCQQTMDALETLKTTLEGELKPFIIQNIPD